MLYHRIWLFFSQTESLLVTWPFCLVGIIWPMILVFKWQWTMFSKKVVEYLVLIYSIKMPLQTKVYTQGICTLSLLINQITTIHVLVTRMKLFTPFPPPAPPLWNKRSDWTSDNRPAQFKKSIVRAILDIGARVDTFSPALHARWLWKPYISVYAHKLVL